jgi:hypothetical protein
MVVKRIISYIVLSPNLALWYPKGSYFDLLVYSDADYADAKWIEKVPPEFTNFMGDPLSLSLQRNKILFSYPRLKRSMSPSKVVVHNFYGCDKLSRTMITL